jgi:hypothetical protein
MDEYKDIYDTNITMCLLGYQYTTEMLGKEQFKAMDDIAKTRPNSFTKESAIDLYLLGYIYGKRAERASRKRGTC